MSFCPMRMTMVRTREVDFTGATVLTMFPENDTSVPLTFTAYSATVKSGFDSVVVDWDDGTVETLTPDATTRAVTLSHTYGSRTQRTVRIQNKLDTLVFSYAQPTSGDCYKLGLSATHTGAKPLTGVTNLGSNITNRTLSMGMFSNTSLTSYPSVYGAPALTSANTAALCIPFACFYNCPKLPNLTGIPSNLKALDAYAFAHCTSLASVAGLSNSTGLLHIGFMAFGRCTSLASLSGITATLNPTPATLFGGNLNDSTVRSTVFPSPTYNTEQMRSYRMNLFMFPIAPFAFYGCSSLTDLAGLAVSSGQRIPPGAFQNCSSLVTVPDSIKSARYADREYRNTYTGGNAYRVAYGLAPANYTTSSLSTTYFYYSSCGQYFSGDSLLGAKYIDGAFSGTAITEFIGLNSVRDTDYSTTYRSAFGSREFANCPNVTTMTFQNSVEYLNFMGDTFSGCTNLKDVRFPNLTTSQVRNNIWMVTSPSYGGYNSSSYAFGLPSGCVITCSDGTLTV